MSGLRVHDILLHKIEAVVHEPLLVSRTDRVTVRDLLLAQRRQVAGGDGPGIFKGARDRERTIRSALSSSQHPQVIDQRT